MQLMQSGDVARHAGGPARRGRNRTARSGPYVRPAADAVRQQPGRPTQSPNRLGWGGFALNLAYTPVKVAASLKVGRGCNPPSCSHLPDPVAFKQLHRRDLYIWHISDARALVSCCLARLQDWVSGSAAARSEEDPCDGEQHSCQLSISWSGLIFLNCSSLRNFSVALIPAQAPPLTEAAQHSASTRCRPVSSSLAFLSKVKVNVSVHQVVLQCADGAVCAGRSWRRGQ